jgi:glycosyltransferase involved in cell wall biosynthesis
MKKIIFVDYTSANNQNSIKNKAIGASEYQMYNLLEELSKYTHIYCFNFTNRETIIDNITYNHFDNLINFNINEDDIIIFQRFLPHDENLLNKIKNNKKYLWIHDITHHSIFLKNDQNIINKYNSNEEIFKEEILYPIINNETIYFICNSLACKNMFINFLSRFNVKINENKLHLIYNILYENELITDDNFIINENNIVYASAWQKGIEKVISVFDYIFNKNNNITLTLMSPGYDYHNFQDYKKMLEEKYGDNIIILGPMNKREYAKIIKSACCVLSSTFYETFGCVFAESYYLGTPVIADNRSGAVVEIIGKENIVNYNNPEEVYNKFIDIKNNRNILNIKLDEKFCFDYNLHSWLEILFIEK